MLGLGKSLVRESAVNSYAQRLAYAFSSRVKQDGGLVESVSCLISSLKDLITGSDSLLIDRYASPAAAYSLRKLRRDYLGPAIRVRRESDDQELDVFFDSYGNLDTAALDAFCAGTYGYVDTWYDQANGNDATQDAHDKQPNIYYTTYDNALLQSNNFGDDTTWVIASASVTSGESGYDGSSDAWLLSKSGANGRTERTLSISGVQTFSIYAKANTATWLKLQAYDGSLYRTTSFNLSGDGVIGNEYNLTDANILSLGNGWYRCSIIFSGPTQKVYVYPAGGDNDTTQTSGSIYIQDAQLETGDTATDYVETTTTPAVRMGYVVTENGKPALEFDGSDDYLQTPAISALNTDLQSSFIVVTDDSGDISLRFAWRSSYTSGAAGLSNVLTSVFKSNVFGFHARASNGTYQGVSNALPTNQGLISTAWNASDVVSGKLNGVDFTTNNDTGADAVPIGHNFTRIGSDSSSTQYFWQGTMQEIIFYPSDETSNGTNIETNINDYYDIYS